VEGTRLRYVLLTDRRYTTIGEVMRIHGAMPA